MKKTVWVIKVGRRCLLVTYYEAEFIGLIVRYKLDKVRPEKRRLCVQLIILWHLFKLRINLSPFTKDFRGEEQLMSLDRLIFGRPGQFDRATKS